jgi:hypothetical protein
MHRIDGRQTKRHDRSAVSTQNFFKKPSVSRPGLNADNLLRLNI